MATKTTETAIVPVDAANYAIVGFNAGELQEALAANLDGETLGYNDITRVKVPGSGGLAWQIPSDDGGRPQIAQTIQGVIAFTELTRVLYLQAFGGKTEGGAKPPDCFGRPDATGVWHGSRSKAWISAAATEQGVISGDLSTDGTIQDCQNCPFAKFGSGAFKGKPKAQACDQKRPIYLATEDSILPIAIVAPVGSLDNAKKYLVGLSKKTLQYTDVVTEVGLEPAKNAGGIEYAKITFRNVAPLPPEQRATFRAYRAAIKPLLQSLSQAVSSGNEETQTFLDGPTPED